MRMIGNMRTNKMELEKAPITRLDKDGWYKITDAEYFSLDALHAGQIKDILQSAAHYKARKEEHKYTDAMHFGSCVHSMIFQPELNEVVCGPDVRRNTNAWKEFEEQNAGKYILKPNGSGSYSEASTMRDVALNSPEVKDILSNGKPELTGFVKYPKYNIVIKVDYMRDDLQVMVDYKTTKDARTRQFSNSVVYDKYYISAALYRIVGKAIDNIWYDYIFLAQEKEPPYAIRAYNCPSELIIQGEKEIREALEVYEKCLETDKWPSYDLWGQLIIPGYL
jgi:hypothetical protein